MRFLNTLGCEDSTQKYATKWGAYESERPHFTWARELSDSNEETKLEKSPEAFLMDLADDITYQSMTWTIFIGLGWFQLTD